MQRSATLAIPIAGSGGWLRLDTRTVALGVVLAAALALRVAAFITQVYVIYPDETFQQFEQAHRLIFGSGVVPWEYLEGVRSWMLPGLLAAVMWCVSRFSDSPMAYVDAIRFGCSVLSLSVVFVGFRMAEQSGLWAAVLTGAICAMSLELLWFAPTVMAEVIAAHLVVLALWFGNSRRDGSLRWVGIGLALAACLRFQYAPAIAAAALCTFRLEWSRWRHVAAGGLPVVVACGLLDWLTLGTPFQSIWLNFILNTFHGVASAMGRQPASYFVAYLHEAFRPAALIFPLVLIGALRAPGLAVAAVVALLTHSLVPHKEMRFVYLTVATVPILAGLGIVETLSWLENRGFPVPVWPVTCVLLVLIASLLWHEAEGGRLLERWQFHRATIEAILDARRRPELCGIAASDELFIGTGGYTYLHRRVPLFLGELPQTRRLAGADIPLRSRVVLDARPVPQVASAALGTMTSHFNVLLAGPGEALPGFALDQCFNDVSRSATGAPPLCLYERPGSCTSP